MLAAITEGGDKARKAIFDDLRKKVLAAGYDGLVYQNDYEDVGQTSYVALKPDQIEGQAKPPQRQAKKTRQAKAAKPTAFDDLSPDVASALREKRVPAMVVESLRAAVRENVSPEYLNSNIESLKNFGVDSKTIAQAMSDLQRPEFVKDAEGRLRGSGNLYDVGRAAVDAAIVTGWKVYRAGMSFAKWSREVVKEAGQKVRPHLRKAWNQIQRFMRDQRGSAELDLGLRKAARALVVHNIPSKYLSSLVQRGTHAAPSLAVVRPERGFSEYGEVTLVAKPGVLKDVPVYPHDAYSARLSDLPEGTPEEQAKASQKLWNDKMELPQF